MEKRRYVRDSLRLIGAVGAGFLVTHLLHTLGLTFQNANVIPEVSEEFQAARMVVREKKQGNTRLQSSEIINNEAKIVIVADDGTVLYQSVPGTIERY